jgi:8-oxo-dGTP pyrophosphatase MutT (NUDIX family)
MPVSVKGVVFDDASRILLGFNPRHEWELPGGRPDETDATPQDVLSREIAEETGLRVEVGQILDSWIYDVRNEGKVLILTYLCFSGSTNELSKSHEHSNLKFFTHRDIAPLPLPDGYRRSIELALFVKNGGKSDVSHG